MIPSLSITLDGIPQVPSKRKHNSVDRNSVMRPSATLSTPWSLCPSLVQGTQERDDPGVYRLLG
ncbi:hypothetical protein SCLCIDRAFT_1212821 [Scleroderma citrinum Foug A]|uniref:Uncharacterized protein n=1 Tax=Scleroderma citrinum Foug A TaxID=1036808 RepID=A0A0C3AIM0_9AGAM|nr:hypothetical protein SCLCIDRAFT_1212821 [Scleroderma citrinum Foug A]